MKSYLETNIQNCIKEFNLLFNQDNYISKKVFDKFLDKYSDTFNLVLKEKQELVSDNYKKIIQIMDNGYRMVDNYNKKYTERKLIEYKDYFDNMFKNIDSNILLDNEQRKAIITDEDYSLVIAGAGSGKTTTMAAKVKYLIEKKNVKPNKIILLAFTNKAASELDSRINNDFKLGVEVLTFHKLGMNFIRKLFDSPVKIIGEGRMYEIITKYIKEIVFPNKILLKELLELFSKYVSFDERSLEFDSFDDYFRYYADKVYDKNKDNLKGYITDRIKYRKKNYKTINGEYVKSFAEVDIANFLFINGINYNYEKTYPYKVSNNHSYIPDFTLNLFDKELYIEYYGLTTYQSDSNFTVDDISFYNKLIEKKRQLHDKYKTDLIELYSSYKSNTNYIKELKEEINKRNIVLTPLSNTEIFYRLIYTAQDVHFIKFAHLMMVFISHFKEKGYSLNDFDELINKTNDEKIKKQLKFISKIYNYYQHEIHYNYEIDFQDMINYAYRGMEKVKNKYKYLTYDYLIIDEYQDISKQRYNFAKRLSDLFNAKIVAVGDDWQSIFAFSGSDVELFTKFYDLMGYAEIIKITKTYRNSQELIDVAGDFVSKNTLQFQKRLLSDKHMRHPIEIVYYDEDSTNYNKAYALEHIIASIYNNNPNNKILLLGRYKDDIEEFIDSGLFKYGKHDQIICKKYNAYIEFLTVHASKGLGYDQVILLNAKNALRGFPSQIKDEEIIKILNEEKVEVVEYPEERRLFYVAITRTKNKLYILCPYEFNKRSDFIKEITDYNSVLETIDI